MLLPEPFSPTMACTSPARSSNEHERRARVAPNAFATPMTASSGVGRAREGAADGPVTGSALTATIRVTC